MADDRKGEAGALLCSLCDRAFSSPLSLSEHRALHENRALYVCPVCGRPFRQNTGLWRHLKTHRSAEQRTKRMTFPCRTCGRNFSRPDYLRSHANAHAGKRNTHVCQTCGKGFHQRSDLKRHALTHVRERPFACSLCAKAFADRSTRNRHEREHGSSRTHACTACGAAFKRANKLKEHISRAHPGGTLESGTAPRPSLARCDDRTDGSTVADAPDLESALSSPPSDGGTAASPDDGETEPDSSSVYRAELASEAEAGRGDDGAALRSVLELHDETDFVNFPDFSSQKYYNWLAGFASVCSLLPMPLDDVVFGRVTQVAKKLGDALASPSGVLASRHNFKILFGISEDLRHVAARHLTHVMERLQGP